MLKIGLVGVGGISGAHIPAWNAMEDTTLTAICDQISSCSKGCTGTSALRCRCWYYCQCSGSCGSFDRSQG